MCSNAYSILTHRWTYRIIFICVDISRTNWDKYTCPGYYGHLLGLRMHIHLDFVCIFTNVHNRHIRTSMHAADRRPSPFRFIFFVARKLRAGLSEGVPHATFHFSFVVVSRFGGRGQPRFTYETGDMVSCSFVLNEKTCVPRFTLYFINLICITACVSVNSSLARGHFLHCATFDR